MEAKLEVLIVSSQGTHGGNRSWRVRKDPLPSLRCECFCHHLDFGQTASLQNFEVIHFCFWCHLLVVHFYSSPSKRINLWTETIKIMPSPWSLTFLFKPEMIHSKPHMIHQFTVLPCSPLLVLGEWYSPHRGLTWKKPISWDHNNNGSQLLADSMWQPLDEYSPRMTLTSDFKCIHLICT